MFVNIAFVIIVMLNTFFWIVNTSRCKKWLNVYGSNSLDSNDLNLCESLSILNMKPEMMLFNIQL